MKRLTERLISLILIVFLLAAYGTNVISVFAADSLVREVISEDMDSKNFEPDMLDPSSDFTVSSLNSINGKSLLINKLSCSWLGLNIEDYIVNIELKFKCVSGFDGVFLINARMDNGDTDENIVSVYSSNDELHLYDNENNEIYDFSFNTIYKLRLTLNRGSNYYSVYINDSKINQNISLAKNIYSVNSLNFTVDNDNGLSDLVIDDIFVTKQGKSYPQLYSAQTLGSIQDETFEAYSDPTDYKFYINQKNIEFTRRIVAEDKSVFVPAKELFENIGMEYTSNDNNVTVKNKNLILVFTNDSNSATINGKNIVLNSAPKKLDGIVYVPLHLINEALNAKVWTDENAKMIVMTTGKYKTDNILRLINGKLYMNGEPYYEISYFAGNLFNDLYNAYSADVNVFSESKEYIQTENILRSLSENGFHSIRTFLYLNDNYYMSNSVSDKDVFYNCVSSFFDMCDKYDIKVVPCLGLNSEMHLNSVYSDQNGWIRGNENTVDLVSDTESQSQKDMLFFLDEFVTRFKERNTILFWELADGGNLKADVGMTNGEVSYSLIHLADFYNTCADKIRKIDNIRLISSGDSLLRTSQWHLLKATLSGLGEDYTFDTIGERLNALNLLNKNLDIISIQGNNVGNSSNAESYYADSAGAKVLLTYDRIKTDALTLGKGLYDGKCYGISETSQKEEDGISDYLDSLIDSDIQIAYWNSEYDSDLTSGYIDGNIGRIISEANSKIKQKYIVNKSSSDNTFSSWYDSNFDVFDPENINTGSSNKTKVLAIGIAKVVAVVLATAVVILITLAGIKRKENMQRRVR